MVEETWWRIVGVFLIGSDRAIIVAKKDAILDLKRLRVN